MRGQARRKVRREGVSEPPRAAAGASTNVISKLHDHKVRKSLSDVNHIEQGQLLKGFLKL